MCSCNHDEICTVGDEDLAMDRTASHHMQAAQVLFPSCLCAAAISIINSLEDPQVNKEGISGKFYSCCHY